MRAGQATDSSETSRPMARGGEISHDHRFLHGQSVRDDVRLRPHYCGRKWLGEEWRGGKLQASGVEERDAAVAERATNRRGG